SCPLPTPHSPLPPIPSPMLTIQVRYAGNKKCDLAHPAGPTLRTDAPKDIGGDASAFSPTDLVAAGLASCILTTIAMYAERNGFDITNNGSGPMPAATVEKHMSQPPAPRRTARPPPLGTPAPARPPE